MALTKAKASNILLTTPAASSNDVTPATTEYVTTAIANSAASTHTGTVDSATVDGENFKVNGAQGSDGQVITSTGSGVAWEDIPSDMVVSSTAPSSPSQGDMWFNSSASTVSDIESKMAAVYDGTKWVQMTSKLSATGGTITTSGNYTVHTFTSSGTLTVSGSGEVEY